MKLDLNEFNENEFIQDMKDLYIFMGKIFKISEEFFDLMNGNIYENKETKTIYYYDEV